MENMKVAEAKARKRDARRTSRMDATGYDWSTTAHVVQVLVRKGDSASQSKESLAQIPLFQFCCMPEQVSPSHRAHEAASQGTGEGGLGNHDCYYSDYSYSCEYRSS